MNMWISPAVTDDAVFTLMLPSKMLRGLSVRKCQNLNGQAQPDYIDKIRDVDGHVFEGIIPYAYYSSKVAFDIDTERTIPTQKNISLISSMASQD